MDKLFKELNSLLDKYKSQAGSVSYHNFVNNDDIVPRLLGTNSLGIPHLEKILGVLSHGITVSFHQTTNQ